jgi:hypothetical protein
MDARHWLSEVRKELVRRALPRRYINRFVLELSDHVTDFTEDSMSTDVQESRSIIDRLGIPSQLADQAAVEFRHQRFTARHPWMVFAALPVVLLPLLWIGFALGIWAVLEVATGFVGDVPDGPLASWIEWCILLVAYCMMNLPILLSAWLICRMARNAVMGWKWSLLACLLLAGVASSVYPHVQMKTADQQGLVCFITPYWNLYPPADASDAPRLKVPRTARIAQIVQAALALVAVALSTWRQAGARPRRLAT